MVWRWYHVLKLWLILWTLKGNFSHFSNAIQILCVPEDRQSLDPWIILWIIGFFVGYLDHPCSTPGSSCTFPMVNFPPAPDFLGMEFGGERKRTTNERFVCISVSNHIVKLRSPKDDDVSPMIHISVTTGSGYNNRKREKGLHKPNQWVFKTRGSFAWSAWATTVQVLGLVVNAKRKMVCSW